MGNIILTVLSAIGFTVASVLFVVLCTSLVLMLAWNFVVPQLFHLPTIDWFQSLCLSYIATALFKPIIFMPPTKGN